jgi:hypothetical protein
MKTPKLTVAIVTAESDRLVVAVFSDREKALRFQKYCQWKTAVDEFTLDEQEPPSMTRDLFEAETVQEMPGLSRNNVFSVDCSGSADEHQLEYCRVERFTVPTIRTVVLWAYSKKAKTFYYETTAF